MSERKTTGVKKTTRRGKRRKRERKGLTRDFVRGSGEPNHKNRPGEIKREKQEKKKVWIHED